MTEPTLLQQARETYDGTRPVLLGDVDARAFNVLRTAVGLLLHYLEQREAAMQSVTAMCNECGLHRQHWAHDRTQDGNTDPERPELKPHTFAPKSVDARLVELEAMSEAHGHNISTLFADLDAYLEHSRAKPAQVPGKPAHPFCYDLNGNPRCRVCGVTEEAHSSEHEFAVPRGPAQLPGDELIKASSFGTADVAALSAQVPDEIAQRIVARADALAAESTDLDLEVTVTEEDRERAESIVLGVRNETVTAREIAWELAHNRAVTRRDASAALDVDLDLDALQKLCDAATPGPWTVDGANVECPLGTVAECTDTETKPQPEACFIAAARDALPKLIAEVRRLRG